MDRSSPPVAAAFHQCSSGSAFDRRHGPARVYAERRTEGKSKTKIIRCLKRYIVRDIYHALLADRQPRPETHRRPYPTVSITCGAATIRP